MRAPAVSPDDQQSLVDRIHRGDSAAEGELLQAFQERLLVMLTARTRDPEAARELAQETMIVVLGALRKGNVREPERLGGFIHGVARNLANNHLRLRVRDRQRYTPIAEDVAVVTPPDAVDATERIALVRSALRRLSWLDRRILTLSLVAGWEPRTIGRVLGLTASIVRTRKSRALNKVQEIVRQLTRSGPPVPRS
jgi:RNA polymerase sigma-70 factor (ECF subfamily)